MRDALELRQIHCFTGVELFWLLFDLVLSVIPLIPTTMALRTLERAMKWFSWTQKLGGALPMPNYPEIKWDYEFWDVRDYPVLTSDIIL